MISNPFLRPRLHLLLALGIVLPLHLFAQVPALIVNQGRLFDGQQMLDGEFTLVSRIYTNATEGTFLFEDTSRVRVSDGYYTTYIGANPTFGSLEEALATGEAYIEVSADGVVFPPRELIPAVGFAIRAGEADALRGGTVGADMLARGAVTTEALAHDTVTEDKLAPELRAELERLARAVDEGAAETERARSRGLRVEPRAESPNLIGGHVANQAGMDTDGAVVSGGGTIDQPNVAAGRFSVVGGGLGNLASGARATVAGGRQNVAGGNTAFVGGGFRNEATAAYAVVAGGYENEASGYVAGVASGWRNQASGDVAAIGGGQENRALGAASVVPGGWMNCAEGFAAAAGGGFQNLASGDFAVVGGGSNNVASGAYAVIPGGAANTAAGRAGVAMGSAAHADHDGTFVWADTAGGEFRSTGEGQFLIRAGGNVGIDTSSPDEKLTVAGNVAPAQDGAHQLGTETARWQRLHLDGEIEHGERLLIVSHGATNAAFLADGTVYLPGRVVLGELQGDGAGLTGVTASVIGAGSVTDESVHADAAIDPTKIAGIALTADTLFDGDVEGDVSNLVLRPGAVRSEAIADGAVSERKLATRSVTSRHLQDGAVTAAKLDAQLLEQFDSAQGAWSLSGNEIVGAEESFLGTINAMPFELRVDGRRALRIDPTEAAPNWVAGYEQNSAAGAVVGATIGGGGGAEEKAHRVTGNHGTIAGGLGNTVANEYATIGGGINNTAAGSASTVAGGWKNTASDLNATIGGGQDNVAAGSAATVGGGLNNRADGAYATVPGGTDNVVQGDYGFAAGRGARAMHDGAFVWADSRDGAFASTAPNQVLLRAAGNVGIDTANPAEKLTVAGNVAPDASDRHDLGSGARRWRTLFLSSHIDYAGDMKWVSGTESRLSLDGDGNMVVQGSVRASTFVGDGSGLSGLSGEGLRAGSITDLQVSPLAAIDPRKIAGIALTEATRFGGDLDGDFRSLAIRDGAVRGAKLADGAVTSAKIRPGSITAEHLTDELLASLHTVPDAWGLGGNSGTRSQRDFIGTLDNEAMELRVNGRRALRLEPTSGSPNLLGGDPQNEVRRGSVGAAVLSGGSRANPNRAAGNYAVVAGGVGNRADDEYATVGGGFGNQATGFDATISGGQDNVAAGSGSVISGGFTNLASGSFASIGGGAANRVGGNVAAVSGGFSNVADGGYAAVPGGAQNEALGDYSFASGRRAKARHPGAWVWADSRDEDFASTRGDQFLIRASGGVGIGLNNPQHMLHLAGGAFSDGRVWASASDEALKDDFLPVDAAELLDRLARLRITSWRYRDDARGTRHLGPTAQDFQDAFGFGDDPRTIASVDAQGVALAAIQELYRRNEDLSQENRELRDRLALIEQRLNQLLAP